MTPSLGRLGSARQAPHFCKQLGGLDPVDHVTPKNAESCFGEGWINGAQRWNGRVISSQFRKHDWNIYIYADVGISLAPSFQARPALSGCKWQSNSLKMAAHISAVTRNPLLALLAQYSSKINSIMSRISHDFDFKLSATAFATTPVPCCSKLTQQVDAPRQSFLYAFQL